MAPINSAAVQAQAIKSIIQTNSNSWGLAGVYYGDQQKIPRTPVICVESGPKDVGLAGAPRRVEVRLITYVLIYHALVSSAEDIRLENDLFVDQVEAKIQEDPQLKDGLGVARLVHGFVTKVEPGYTMKSGSLMRATRITYEGTSKVQLPSAQ